MFNVLRSNNLQQTPAIKIELYHTSLFSKSKYTVGSRSRIFGPLRVKNVRLAISSMGSETANIAAY